MASFYKISSGYALFIFTLLFFSGGFGLYKSIISYNKSNIQKKWNQTTGNVVSSKCSEYMHSSGSRYNKNIYKMYKCDIIVSYTINGVSYQGTVQTNRETTYTNGEKLLIYYDTSNPNNIDIEIGSTKSSLVSIILFILILGISIYGFNYCRTKSCPTIGSIFFLSNVFNRN